MIDNASKMKIEIDLGISNRYAIIPLYKCLELVQKKYNFELSETHKEPYRGIYVNEQLIALIDVSDFIPVWKYMRPYQNKGIPILKWQVDRHYLGLNNVISAGYFSPLMHLNPYIQTKKTIDIMSRMRSSYTHNYIDERVKIMKIADKLATEGYNTCSQKINTTKYFEELGRTQIGFNWMGKGHLNFRIIEYIQNEIVMITDPLGQRFPIREDVIIEDDKHAVFCDKPEKFYKTAKLLLKDSIKINRIRKNIKELWKEKLCPIETGEWYYKTIKKLAGVGNEEI